jgi:hypothetical protein
MLIQLLLAHVRAAATARRRIAMRPTFCDWSRHAQSPRSFFLGLAD